MFEHAAQMPDVSPTAQIVEALMGERDPSGSQPGQQLLDFGRPFPGVDAFGSVHVAEDVDDGAHRGRVRGVVDHQNGQIVADRAAGALAPAKDFTFGTAGAALVIALDSGADQAHRPGVSAVGASGEHAVVAAERADPVETVGPPAGKRGRPLTMCILRRGPDSRVLRSTSIARRRRNHADEARAEVEIGGREVREHEQGAGFPR